MIRRNSFRTSISSATTHKITVRLLDDNEVIQLDFQAHQRGQFLMDYVCRKLNIAEKDYFGLRYVDGNKERHWMDLGKSIVKQLKELTPFIVCFRFKFYPGEPMILKEDVTKYQLVLQLRRDLLHGRLYSTNSDMATLAAYIVQSELGDFNPETHKGNYVSEYELIARQSAEFEEKVKELHAGLVGTTPSDADVQFLKKAASLDTYGIDPHPVKDQKGEQIFLGINHAGISTFQGSKKSSHWKWSQISKLNYEAKMFIIHVSTVEDSRTKKKETFGFKCQTSGACKHLWRCAVEQRLFFNCGSANEITAVRGGGLFGSKFKYSGKVLKEILEDPGPLRATDGVIQRTPLYRSLQRPNKLRGVGGSPVDENNRGYSTLPRSNHSAPSTGIDSIAGIAMDLASSESLPLSMSTLTSSSTYNPEQTLPLPLLETLEEDSPRAEEKEHLLAGSEESTSWVFEGNGEGDPNGDILSTIPEQPQSLISEITVSTASPNSSESKNINAIAVNPYKRLPSIEEEELADTATSIGKSALKKHRKFGISCPPDPLILLFNNNEHELLTMPVVEPITQPVTPAVASETLEPVLNVDSETETSTSGTLIL